MIRAIKASVLHVEERVGIWRDGFFIRTAIIKKLSGFSCNLISNKVTILVLKSPITEVIEERLKREILQSMPHPESSKIE